MGWFVKLMFVVGVVLSFALIRFSFSDTLKAVFISIIGGVIVFVLYSLVSALRNSISLAGDRKKDSAIVEKVRIRKKRDSVIGVIFFIVSIVFFLNSYLYVKAMLGNDMLVSLKLDKENMIIKNGEEGQINLYAKVLLNPFCEAGCSLSIKNLGTGEIVYSGDTFIKVSSPLSKTYSVFPDSGKSGQTLYRVSIECNTIKSRLCYTSSNVTKSRTRIVSVNYELDDTQEKMKEELKNRTETLNNRFNDVQSNLNNLSLNFSSLDLSKFINYFPDLDNISYSIQEEIYNLSILYENQDYFELQRELPLTEERIGTIENEFVELNELITNDINNYNLLIDKLNFMHNSVLYLRNSNFSDSSFPFANSFVRNFNLAILDIGNYNTIEHKMALFNNLEFEKENLLSMLKNDSDNGVLTENELSIFINPVNLQKISIQNVTYNSNFTLSEPLPICCLNNECYKCIDNSSSNYPIILVHGHSFNEKISAELSMESFGEMAKQMEKEGYIDAGYFYGSQYDETSKGYLGKVNSSVVVEATYYLDNLVNDEGSFILNSKWEDIDTYASRLNEIVSNVKYLTGKDKVIIVAHSMGGLVSRRYIQLYGEESLDKLILVGTPNHGIDGLILSSCPVFGADIECGEMNKTSLFMEELNNAPLPSIPFYNIVGTGCPIEGSEGDGIVKVESAYLKGAENIYVSGICKGVDFFHVNMIKPSRHPEIYSRIMNFIKE